ncbi:MAG TPA: hypothetical protein PK037_01910 [Saprospiraceae bacterium]|nr:hypothetical protein [Saprospiraceae bacterium]
MKQTRVQLSEIIKYFVIAGITMAMTSYSFGQKEGTLNRNIKLSGNATVFGALSNSSDSNVVVNPYSYGVSISTSLKTKYITLPFSFRYAGNGNNVTYPFVRFGMAPRIKWAKFYLGNNNINFSRYAFTGYNVFGLGFEINPAAFYLGAFVGDIRKAIFIDSTASSYNKIAPKYKTRGYAIKAGIKTRKNALLLSYASAFDDENSLIYFNPKYNITPRKSKTIGGEILLTLFQNVIYHFNAGASIYTRNVNGIHLDSILRNSGEKELPKWTGKIEKSPNLTTQVMYAHDHLLSFASEVFNLNLRYKYIQPEYKALGLANINTDLSQWSIEPGFKLLGKKLNLNLVLGKQANNLNQKLITKNNNTIFNLLATYIPNDRLSANVAYSSFGLRTNASDPDKLDSISIQNVSNNISLNVNYTLSKSTDVIQSLNVNFSRQGLKEVYEYSPLFDKSFNNVNTLFVYNHNDLKEISYSFGLNYNNSYSLFLATQNIKGNVKSYGINGGASKNLMNEKINLNLNGSFNLAGTEEEKSQPAFSLGLSFSYALTTKSSLVLSGTTSRMTISGRAIVQNYFNANITQNF